MNINSRPIRNWFGFTRRERRSAFIMLLIIALILGSRYIIPDSMIDIEDIAGTIAEPEKHSDFSGKDSISGEPFSAKALTRGKPESAFTKNVFGSEGKSIRPSDVKKMTLQKAGVYSGQQNPPVEINSSDSAMLVQLPGIGPVLSARIIKYRSLLGGFARIDQLREVYGLKEETYEMIKGRIFADTTMITRIDINTAGYKELSHIVYLEKYEVTAILKYRELIGRITKITDLTENRLITEEKARKLGPYIKYEE